MAPHKHARRCARRRTPRRARTPGPVRRGRGTQKLTTPAGDTVTTAALPTGDLLATWRASHAHSVIAASSAIPSGLAVRAVFPALYMLMRSPALRRFAIGRVARIPIRERERRMKFSWGRPGRMERRHELRRLATTRRRPALHRGGHRRDWPLPARATGTTRRLHPGCAVRSITGRRRRGRIRLTATPSRPALERQSQAQRPRTGPGDCHEPRLFRLVSTYAGSALGGTTDLWGSITGSGLGGLAGWDHR